ncbi:MAG: hypothetical protein GXO07_02380 [Crenarchaeota archaeon]|nr:hypothetical protein [Thermoproteota archaeon]
MLYSRYPFIGSVSKLSKKVFGTEMDPEELLEIYPDALEKAREILLSALGERTQEIACDDLCAVVAYRLAIAVVASLGSKWLINAFAVSVAKKASEFLKKETLATLTGVVRLCGFEIENLREPLKIPVRERRGTVYEEEYPVRMFLTEYVRLAKRFLSDPSWKVVNKALLEGFVYLTPPEVARLAEEAVVQKVLNDIKELGKVEEEALPERLKPLVEEVKSKISKRLSKSSLGRPTGLKKEALPPCIRAIYAKALQGENLSHQERFALATFLLNVGLDVDRVLEIFQNMPDYNERIARYQVEHLAGMRGSHKKYSPPSCKTMVSWGLCPGREECKKQHPLSEYYRRLTKAPSREPSSSRPKPRQAS